MGFWNAMKCVSVWLFNPERESFQKKYTFPLNTPSPTPWKNMMDKKKGGENLEGEKQDVSTHGVKKVKFIPSDF